MKVLLLVPEFPPDSIGGGGIVFEALRSSYHEHHDVKVVAGSTGIAKHDPRDGVLGITRVNEPPLPHALRYLATTLPPTPRGLVSLLREIRSVDVVHAHGYGFPVVDLGIRLARRRGIPVLHTLHGFPVSQDKRGGWVAAAFRLYARISGTPALRASSAHTAVSEAVATFYRERFALPVSVIPNGVELPQAEAWAELDTWRDRTRPLVVAVGRLEWIKGFDLLLEAVAGLDPDSRPQILLIGADHGDGSKLQELAVRHGISSLVWLAGPQSRARVALAYRRATCTVVASHTEAFPAVPLEAMASGTALVSSRLAGIASYAVDRQNCLLFDVGDATGLRTCLQEILSDQHLRERVAAAGTATAQRFGWPSVAEQYERRFTELVADTAGSVR